MKEILLELEAEALNAKTVWGINQKLLNRALNLFKSDEEKERIRGEKLLQDVGVNIAELLGLKKNRASDSGIGELADWVKEVTRTRTTIYSGDN